MFHSHDASRIGADPRFGNRTHVCACVLQWRVLACDGRMMMDGFGNFQIFPMARIQFRVEN